MLKRIGKKQLVIFFGLLLLSVGMYKTGVMAMEDKDIIRILSQNSELFVKNGIVNSAFRFIGWGITKGITALADVSSSLYDTCFGFIDFTKYEPVTSFINKWKMVFIGLVCLSLLLIGILLCVGWEKKPTIVINLLIAVTVVSSGTYVISTLNKFISTEVREEILEGQGSSVVYNTIGNNIHDLRWLNKTVGLENLNKEKNADKVYEKFTKNQFKNMDIQEIMDPSDFDGNAEEILKNGLEENDEKDKTTYELDELYDGVAWTDLLNKFYYRYTVDYGVMWMELISLIFIYLFMSYKVVRILYEIVIHQLLAYLYSANLNNNQKVLKILDSLKDSYILLLMTTVMIKFYLFATKYISSWNVSGIAKGIILVFIAFVVIDGPNLIQKLTGTDAGASGLLDKMMSFFYLGKMGAGAAGMAANAAKFGVHTAVGTAKFGVGATAKAGGKIKEMFENRRSDGSADGMESGTGTNSEDNILNQQNGQPERGQGDSHSPNQSNQNQSSQNNSPNSNNNSYEDKRDTTDGNHGNMQSGKNGKPENFNNEENPKAGKSALSGGQDKKNDHYPAGQIGNNQSRNDALNGVERNKGNMSDTESSLRQMDKELSSDKAAHISAPENNRPIDTGGKMFERGAVLKDESNSQNSKKIFETDAGRKR